MSAASGPDPGDARLHARLTGAPAIPPRAAGRRRLGVGRARDGLLHISPQAAAGRPSPLVVMLHGAGSSGERALEVLASLADEAGLVVLAPDSRAPTWDVIRGGFGPDVAFIDGALERVFAACAIDPGRIVVAGFSDGASYALSLGITNGDLFTHVLAFSPGFMAPAARVGRPRVYMTHGVQDAVLPIDRCSRGLAPRLRAAGYDVTYEEFDGGHVVRPELAARAVAWLG